MAKRRIQLRPRRPLVVVLLLLVGAVAGFLYRGYADTRDVTDSQNRVLQFRSENRELRSQITDLGAKLTAMQAKLTGAQAALDAVMPSKDSFNLTPNQSMVVADGRLTIGLIGPPANEGVSININGKPFTAGAGTTINVALDPSTTCRVEVQSFDMFKAIVTAACPAAKPR